LLAFLAHDSPPRGDDESKLRHLSKIWGPLQKATNIPSLPPKETHKTSNLNNKQIKKNKKAK
jgi:hypothetical protein